MDKIISHFLLLPPFAITCFPTYIHTNPQPKKKKQFLFHFRISILLSIERNEIKKLFIIHVISQLTSLYDAREFSNERGRVERRAQFHKCRSRQMFTEAMSAYLNWITQAGVLFFLYFFYCVFF